MNKLKIINVVGSRPNFVKIASLVHEIKKHQDIQSILVHTGQHYDKELSKSFFRDLNILEPDVNLEVGSGSHAYQTAEIMKRFEKSCLDFKPDLVVVAGDVNSTIACALAAVKLGIKVAHVEAGLRSFDRSMPEEINRIITDSISSYLFTTEESANENLKREGIPENKIFLVGNLMIETLIRFREKARRSTILEQLNLKKKPYVLLTLHRPSNVDDVNSLTRLLEAVKEISDELPVLFPVHPRTKQNIEKFGLLKLFRAKLEKFEAVSSAGVYLLPSLGYLDFLRLMDNAALVLTDSGGIQEETTFLKKPCLTLRENTERPVTVTHGTNNLVRLEPSKIVEESFRILYNKNLTYRKKVKFWDNRVAHRIVNVLLQIDNTFYSKINS